MDSTLRWFMRPHHISPEEAVQVHLDLRSKKSVAIHWGTFILTDEPLDEPPKRLATARQEKGVSEEEFVVLKHGETIVMFTQEAELKRPRLLPTNGSSLPSQKEVRYQGHTDAPTMPCPDYKR